MSAKNLEVVMRFGEAVNAGRDGIEIEQACGTIFTVRDGKIARMQSFWERATAFEAAGLAE